MRSLNFFVLDAQLREICIATLKHFNKTWACREQACFFLAPLRIRARLGLYLLQKCLPFHPTRRFYFFWIWLGFITGKADEYRTNFIFHHAIPYKRIAIRQHLFNMCRSHPEFMREASPRGIDIGLIHGRVPANAVGPGERPGFLHAASLLQQKSPRAIKKEERKSSVEWRPCAMRGEFRHRPEHHVALVYKHNFFVGLRLHKYANTHTPERAGTFFLMDAISEGRSSLTTM